MRRFAERIDRSVAWLENGLLVLLLASLITLAVSQIVLRTFFSFGFIWADELVKLLVLWIALVASVAASRSNQHLRIDMLSHFVPQQYARVPRIVVDFFAAAVCALLAWHAWRYLQLTIEFEDTVLSDVPAWMAYLLLPVCFALMAYRFLLMSFSEVLQFFASKADQGSAS